MILFLLLLGIPWFLEAYDDWLDRRTVRRECALLDAELDLLT